MLWMSSLGFKWGRARWMVPVHLHFSGVLKGGRRTFWRFRCVSRLTCQYVIKWAAYALETWLENPCFYGEGRICNLYGCASPSVASVGQKADLLVSPRNGDFALNTRSRLQCSTQDESKNVSGQNDGIYIQALKWLVDSVFECIAQIPFFGAHQRKRVWSIELRSSNKAGIKVKENLQPDRGARRDLELEPVDKACHCEIYGKEAWKPIKLVHVNMLLKVTK